MNTVKQLVEYAEQWLTGYAQEHGYQGVTMGRHRYNTSVNFSSRKGEVVEQAFTFPQVRYRTHSDILIYDKERQLLKTRAQGGYWLWKR